MDTCLDILGFIFLTAVWLSHGQIWVILEGTASLTWFQSLRLYNLGPKLTGNLVMRLGP